MNTAELTTEEKAALDKHMMGLRDWLCDFENHFGANAPAVIRPEVPEEARAMYLKVFELVNG